MRVAFTILIALLIAFPSCKYLNKNSFERGKDLTFLVQVVTDSTQTRENVKSAVTNTREILKRRIEKYGATVDKVEINQEDLSLVYRLKNVKNAGNLVGALLRQGKFEMYNTYDAEEIIPILGAANARLGILFNSAEYKKQQAQQQKEPTKSSGDALFGDSVVTIPEEEKNKLENPLWQKFYPNYNVTSAANNVLNLYGGSQLGHALIADTADINAWLQLPIVKEVMPRDLLLAWGLPPQENAKVVPLYGIKKAPFTEVAPINNDMVEDAMAGRDAEGNATLELVINGLGTPKWSKMTEDASQGMVNGRPVKKSIAIMIDGVVISAPAVQGKIEGGRCQVTGLNSFEEAEQLAVAISSGQLQAPVQVEIVEQKP